MVELKIGDDKYSVKSEEEIIELVSILKDEGRFGDPIQCPICGKGHELEQTKLHYSFKCYPSCVFYGAFFGDKLSAIRAIRKLKQFTDKLKKSRKVYVNSELKKEELEKKGFKKQEKRATKDFVEKPVAPTKVSESFSKPNRSNELTENSKPADRNESKFGSGPDIQNESKGTSKPNQHNESRLESKPEIDNESTKLSQPEMQNESMVKSQPKDKNEKFQLQKIKHIITSNYKEGKTYKEVAAILNEQNLLTKRGLKWSDKNIFSFVKNNLPYLSKEIHNRRKGKKGKKEITKMIKFLIDKKYGNKEIAVYLNNKNIKTLDDKKWTPNK